MSDDIDSSRKRLWEMVKKHRFAMMTSMNGEKLRSRPMTTIEREGDTLWFFAQSDSEVINEFEHQPQVCLSYSDASSQDFVSITGKALIVRDVAKKRALWNPMVQAWLPEGAESPHVVLIEVVPDHAEYWDGNSSKLVQIFSYAKALASGKPPHDISEHRDVPLNRT